MLLLSGFLFVLSAVAGIGPQNLNIILQGIKKNYSYTTATVSFISDFVIFCICLLSLHFFAQHRYILQIVAIFGLAFLLYLILQKLMQLTKNYQYNSNNLVSSYQQAIIRALSLSFLNPLCWADFITIASVTLSYPNRYDKIKFIIGFLVGDFIWMYSLTFCCLLLSEKMNKLIIWKILDFTSIILISLASYKILLQFFIK